MDQYCMKISAYELNVDIHKLHLHSLNCLLQSLLYSSPSHATDMSVTLHKYLTNKSATRRTPTVNCYHSVKEWHSWTWCMAFSVPYFPLVIIAGRLMMLRYGGKSLTQWMLGQLQQPRLRSAELLVGATVIVCTLPLGVWESSSCICRCGIKL